MALKERIEFVGMKRGQIIRQGTAEWLIARGFLNHPLKHLNNVLDDAKNGGTAK
jgi:hypothetical protein